MLRVFENRVLRRILGPKREDVTGEWRKLHNEELNDLYSPPQTATGVQRSPPSVVFLDVIEEPPTGGLGPLGLSSHEKRKLQQSSGKHKCIYTVRENAQFLVLNREERVLTTWLSKGKVHPRTGHEGPEGEQKYSPNPSLTSALDVGGQRHAPATLLSGKRPGTHCTEGWVGPRASLDGCGKHRPHRDSIPRPSSP
jgi:hypothetical protein